MVNSYDSSSKNSICTNLQNLFEILSTDVYGRSLSPKLIGSADINFVGICTDTRRLVSSNLFVALKGDNFDANDFISQAQSAGAGAAITHLGRLTDLKNTPMLSGIEVTNTLLAFGKIAQYWRSQFNLPMVAVTGSNGKTTVKQMIATIFETAQGSASLSTQGNLNNDIGVPLTLLRLNSSHKLAVVELGMNHPGEIDYLAKITKPTVALVNNAQREHLEFMQTIETVARENGSIIDNLDSNGIAIFPENDIHTSIWKKLAKNRKTLTFGKTSGDIYPKYYQWGNGAWQLNIQTPIGSFDCSLNIAGEHNVINALAATACAVAANISLNHIAQGLSKFRAVNGRSRTLQITFSDTPKDTHNICVIDDTYNANPDSMRSAIDMLSNLPKPNLLIIGDMAEVGDKGIEFHQEIALYAQEKDIDYILLTGQLMDHCLDVISPSYRNKVKYFSELPSLIDETIHIAPQFYSILVKGSRFMRMERVIEALEDASLNSASKGFTHAA